MNTHRSVLFVASLSLAACADIPVRNSTQDASVANAQLCAAHPKLTVHIVEAASGG